MHNINIYIYLMCVCIYYFFYILIDFPTRDNTGKHNTNHSRKHTYPRRNKTVKEEKKTTIKAVCVVVLA